MDKLTIDTPEQVHLEYTLAGLGSRFMAAFLDSLIQAAVLLVLLLVGALFSAALGWAGLSSTWAVAGLILGVFTIVWGYFTLFEMTWKGQTPGKRWAGIRVIKESGRAITPFEAITRNLLRVIDWFPGLYGAGVVTMLLNAKHRRLGDFVAGTLVVHESTDREAGLHVDSSHQAYQALPRAAELSLQEADLIETFLSRRLSIPPEVRRQNAQRIAEMIAGRLGIPADARPPDNEGFLQLLVSEFRNRARIR